MNPLNPSQMLLGQQQLTASQLGGYGTVAPQLQSNSSSPSCSSPTALQQQQQLHQLPALTSVISNGDVHSSSSQLTSPYHQLAIIASPIVISSENLPLSAAGALQPLPGVNSVHCAALGRGSVSAYNPHHSHHHAAAHLLHPSSAGGTLTYASPNAYVTAVSGGELQPDGSPLLSFTEVTNTLLNQ